VAYLQIQLNLLSAAFTTEEQQLAFHGSSFTHIDALCHGDHGGKIYNGYPLKESVTEAGCKKLGIDALHGGVVTRGVLIDIPRLRGVSHLEPGTHVYQEDIEAWEKRAGLTISSGDAIFLHTGRWETGKTSGYDVSLIPWLKNTRRRAHQQRRHPGRERGRRHPPAVAPLRAGRARRQHPGQCRIDRAVRNRGTIEAMGVSVRDGAGRNARRNRIAR